MILFYKNKLRAGGSHYRTLTVNPNGKRNCHCNCYLSLAQAQVEEAHDLSYKIVLNYLTNYFITKNEEYKKNIFETIEYLNKIGEQRFSASIEREVQALLSEEEIVPVFIQADL